MASGWSPIASHCLELELRPGERRDITFLLGYAENPPDSKWESPGVINKEPARRLIQSYSNGRRRRARLAALREHWAGLLG